MQLVLAEMFLKIDEFLKELAFTLGHMFGVKAITNDLIEALFYKLFDGFQAGLHERNTDV